MGPRPIGDPAALEAAAREVLGIAARIQDVDGFIVRALPRAAFEGPGRGRHDAALRTSAQRVSHSADALQRLAGVLGRGAVELRRAQSQWDARDAARRKAEAAAAEKTP